MRYLTIFLLAGMMSVILLVSGCGDASVDSSSQESPGQADTSLVIDTQPTDSEYDFDLVEEDEVDIGELI